jgi:hypothetical protein
MAKLSRNQLKGLIKECLIEVLVEGLNPGSKSEPLLEQARSSKKRASRSGSPQKSLRPALDSVKFNQSVTESVAAITSDPTLANILTDTARTTLQDQLGEEASHGRQVSINGDPAAKQAANSDPADMFGEAANNWAALAFNEV